MPFTPNRKADELIRQRATDRLIAGATAGKAEARRLVPVQSGDLQSTIALSEVTQTSESIKISLVAGGTADSGKTVDYAYEQEVEHGFLRGAIAAISSGIRE